jgi:drug/metabolite transporter (DMT)-like permease
MSMSFAGYLVLSRVLRDEPLSTSLFYTGAGALVPISLVVWRVWTPVTLSDVVVAILTGVLSLLILACFDLAVEAGPLSLVAPMLTLVPAWELGMGIAMHGRSVHAIEAIGVVLVVGAAMLGAQAWRPSDARAARGGADRHRRDGVGP